MEMSCGTFYHIQAKGIFLRSNLEMVSTCQDGGEDYVRIAQKVGLLGGLYPQERGK